MNQLIVSVIILNYNGGQWLGKCFQSLKDQTIFDKIEVIVVDNASMDGSNQYAKSVMASYPNGVFIQNDSNLGFCEGNNRGGALARGRYLFFLNNDTWLEKDCLEVLFLETEREKAGGASPLILNYDSDQIQSIGGDKFDFLGMVVDAQPKNKVAHLLAVPGCAYFIKAELFNEIGGFDRQFFCYNEEVDLSFRVLISGENLIAVPQAKVHHRGSALANPKGGETIVESRTNEQKRFLANRNGILCSLKNFQHFLLLTVFIQVGFLALEMILALFLVKRRAFLKHAYLDAFFACWLLKDHIKESRKKIKQFRKRSDFWFLKFLTWRLGRWPDIRRVFKMGLPIIDKIK